MSVISIVGAAGVGKSMLVKQLAGLHRSPAFFEGEEGVFAPEVIKNLLEGDILSREQWFNKQYAAALTHGHKISSLGMDAYLDGGELTAEAYARFEPEPYRTQLLIELDQYRNIRSDVTVVLTAEPEIIQKFMAMRNRSSEQDPRVFEKAVQIQEVYIELGEKYPHALIIDRTELDFHTHSHLQLIAKKIDEKLQKNS